MRKLAWGAVVVLVVGAVLAGAVGRLMTRDPLAALPRAEGPAAALESRTRRLEARTLLHQSLEAPAVGRIHLTISLPHPLPEGPLPIVVVLGGLGGGEENIRPVRAPGNNALVGYDWPTGTRLPRGIGLFLSAPEFLDQVLGMPGQVAAGIDWVASQPWADGARISVLGYSLGALAAPAVQRLTAEDGNPVGWTVLAYGGSGLGELMAHHPRLRPDWARPMIGWLTGLLLRPIEPAEHLPHLKGRFLVISGKDDSFVPARSSSRLQALTPQPKTVVVLEGGHMGMGPGQERLLADIIRVSRDWLTGAGAINAP